MDKKRTRKIIIGIWLALLPVEIAASLFAYETFGEFFVPLALMAALLFNCLAALMYSYSFYPGAVFALTFGILFVGYQAVLGARLYFLNLEAHHIVHWAYSIKEKTGSFPKDLTGYDLRYPPYQEYLQGYESDGEEYMSVYYYVGTQGTSHYYDTQRGGWGYYPD